MNTMEIEQLGLAKLLNDRQSIVDAARREGRLGFTRLSK